MDLVSISLILLVVGLAITGFGIVTRRERAATPELEERLEHFANVEHTAIEAPAGAREPSGMAKRVDEAVQGKAFTRDISTLLTRADLRLTIGEFLLIRVASTVIAFLVGFLLGRGLTQPLLGLLVGGLMAVLGWMMPHWYVSLRAKRRTRAFVNQLGDTITLMANSLRAGYSLLQTMELVARESPPPMSVEFRRVVYEVGLGISPQQAMSHLLRRIPSEDLDLLVTAINIQHEVGGNLAQILEVIGETIRERVRISGEIRVLTAQQSLSGYVISALPIGMAVLLFFINPGYLSQLFVWPWICMPILGVFLIGLGFLAMRKIVQIDV